MSYKGFDLTGRVAVVVGGTSGIGQALACGLAEAGADVIPTGRRTDLVEAAAKEIEELGRRSLRISSDVLDRSSLQALLDTATHRAGVHVEANEFRFPPASGGLGELLVAGRP